MNAPRTIYAANETPRDTKSIPILRVGGTKLAGTAEAEEWIEMLAMPEQLWKAGGVSSKVGAFAPLRR